MTHTTFRCAIVPVLLVGLHAWLLAGDVDPAPSLRTEHTLTCLENLREPLAQHPRDQHLLGLELMAYLHLALDGDAEHIGAHGPWLAYARKIATIRAAQRQGQPPASGDEAAPELWLRLVDGDAVGVDRDLAAWPGSAELRTLRALATRDWRPLAEREDHGPREAYALVSSGSACGVDRFLSQSVVDQDQLNPATLARLEFQSGAWPAIPRLARAVVADVVLMLADRTIENGQACRDLRLLLAVMKRHPPAERTRAQLIEELSYALPDCDPSRGECMATALAIVSPYAARPGATTGPEGTPLGYGIGDLAAWLTSRLGEAAYLSYLYQRDQGATYEELAASFIPRIAAALPRSFLAASMMIGRQNRADFENDGIPVELYAKLAQAIALELQGATRRFSYPQLHDAIRLAAIGAPGQAADLFFETTKRERQEQQVEEGRALPRPGLVSRCLCAAEVGAIPDVLGDLAEARRNDPWDEDVAELAETYAPATTLLQPLDPAGAVAGTSADINSVSLPLPGHTDLEWFAVRWTGFLHVTTAGDYVLATNSDDGSRLVIGGDVIDNRGSHAMRLRSRTLSLAAGYVPVSIEYFQLDGPGGCQLLWQKPGDPQPMPIPREFLTHGQDHEPGLASEYHALGKAGLKIALRPTADQAGRALAKPYDLGLNQRVGRALFDAGLESAAIPHLRLVQALAPNTNPEMLALALIHATPPDMPGFLALVRESYCIPAEEGLAGEILARLESPEQANALNSSMRGHWLDLPGHRLMQAYLALGAGEFSETATIHRETLESGAYQDFQPGDASRLALEHLILANMLARELPNWQDIESGVKSPVELEVLGALSGAQSWDAARQKLSRLKGGEALDYYQALWLLATGQHDQAQAHFRSVLTMAPPASFVLTSRSLLAWYSRMAAADLEKVPHFPVDLGHPVHALNTKRF